MYQSSSNFSLAKRSLLALNHLQAKLSELEQSKQEPIAIVGMGCRFPQADNPEAFWNLLRAETDAITEIPADRWTLSSYYDSEPNAPNKIYSRWGGFLDRIDAFDAQFFNISPREARSLDPQQRLLLEVSWEALEHANQPTEPLFNTSAGVFIGIATSDYGLRSLQQSNESIDAYFGTGNALSVAAGRLSYTLGLTGPALAIDTACSSSLVAVHLACQSLRQGECRLALAGGVNLILSPENSISISKARMLSVDGRCKTFDARADGYVRSEGCGIVVLKRLSEAVADGDRILALIRGTAVNQDGPSGGLTVPNGPAQQAVIRQALTQANVDPLQVQYVEAHGTGTALGDPIEIQALSAVYGQNREPDRPLRVGSAKTNVGHMESAAGIAGLIKLVLALNHEEIPAHLHFQTPNPHVAWADLPVTINKEVWPWPVGQQPRLAGLSSFSFSGTNAHLVLEEAPPASIPSLSDPSSHRNVHLLTLCAKSEIALQALAGRYADMLKTLPKRDLGDVCFTANSGRSRFKQRLAIVAESSFLLRQQLQDFAQGKSLGFHCYGQTQGCESIAFLFTGQGSQYVGMGQQLYQTQPLFRDTLHQCAEILAPWLDRPLLAILYPDLYPAVQTADCLNQTQYTQPALFALEYALAQLWQSWGIQPTVVMGHSVGEYVAACVAGVFSLEDGLKLIAHRAKLMQNLPANGAMAALGADAECVMAAIAPYGHQVEIAAFNGPQNITISGQRDAVNRVVQSFQSQGMLAQPLAVSHGFHSALMEPMLAEFQQIAQEISYAVPHLRLISNLTGQAIDHEIATADYWIEHVRKPILFAQGIKTILDMGIKVSVEMGPKPLLLGMTRKILNLPPLDPAWLGVPSLQVEAENWHTLLTSLGALFVRGVEVNWAAVDAPFGYQRLTGLPTYPFQRQRYWFSEANHSAAPLPQENQSVSAMPLNGRLNGRSPQPIQSQIPMTALSRMDSPQDRRSQILTLLQQEVGAGLAGPGFNVDPQASFLELGADSINLMQTIQIIDQTFGIQVSMAQFFGELTTLDALATYLEQSLPPHWTIAPSPDASSISVPSSVVTEPSVLSLEQMQQHLAEFDDSTPVVRVIQEQLAVLQSVMTQQLDLLRSQSVGVYETLANPSLQRFAPQQGSPYGQPANAELIALDSAPQIPLRKGSVSPSQTVLQPTQNKASVTISARIPRPDILPLSISQQRMWWTEAWVEDRNVYLIPLAVHIEGTLALGALEQSLNAVIARHESLRTTFQVVDGQPIQRVHPERALTLPLQSMDSDLPQLSEVQACVALLSEPLFNLETDLLVRAMVLQWGDRRHHTLVMVLHHLVADGWSTGILVREMLTLYPAFRDGKAAQLPPLPIQYGDFALWERESLPSNKQSQNLAYWVAQLENAPDQLTLPSDRPRPSHQAFRGQTYHQPFQAEFGQHLKAFSQQSGVTLFMLLLGTYSLLLHQYSGQRDLLIGSTIAKRKWPETQSSIGIFLDTLMFRVNLSETLTVKAFLEHVKQVTLGAFAHPEVPFETLSSALSEQERRTEWFQAMFILQSTPRPQLSLPDLSLSVLTVHGTSSKCDLSLWMIETPDGLRAEWEYNCDLFEAATIERMAGQFTHLLDVILSNPQQPIWSLPRLATAEQNLIERFCQGISAATDPLQPIPVWFEQQVAQTPAAIALEHQSIAWTYQTLNEQANQIAHYLIAQGIGAENLVAVCLERSPELIATLLGILKTGAAYVPLDPTYPQERLRQMMGDANPTAVVTRSALQIALGLKAPIVLNIDESSLGRLPKTNLSVTIQLSQTAYVIYTSGSTGTPKGTLLTHQGLANFTQQAIAQYGFQEGDRTLQFASVSFDAAAEEIYGTLCCGGTLVLRTDEMISSTAAFCKACADQRISILDLPTAFWHRTIQDIAQENAPLPAHLRLIIIGGEKVFTSVVALWQAVNQQHSVRLFNTYGPTEATVVATTYEITPQTQILEGVEIPIGRPLGNVQVYVLDEHLHQQPLGVSGELYLGGYGLATGYLNRTDLTAARFIEHPFKAGERLYKTGDRVRMLPTGDLLYLGRTDDQVKVRGFRVELGEVENILQQHPQVRECAVIAQADAQGINQLIAYVVGASPTLQSQDLRQFMQAQAPDYMVPTIFMTVAAIPLTPAGKLDRRSLPIPQASDWMPATDYVAPRNSIEETLAQQWSELLGISPIGISDNFFSLGGHSLMAMQVISRVQKHFQVQIQLKPLFEEPTIAQLADLILAEQLNQSDPDLLEQLLAELESLPDAGP